MTQSKLIREGRPVAHEHRDISTGESYISTGENILGNIVSSEMERIICETCGSKSVRLKKSL